MSHRYHLGEEVCFSPPKRSMPRTSGTYKIVRRMPLEEGEYTYRIKSTADAYERVAREGELSCLAI
jgi:hypothetical protein